MRARNPFADVNPRHIDLGELIDAATDEEWRPATANEARLSIRRHRREIARGDIFFHQFMEFYFLARVRGPFGFTIDEWRLAVATVLRAQREEARRYREAEARRKAEDPGHA
jgi:hypothetical protein